MKTSLWLVLRSVMVTLIVKPNHPRMILFLNVLKFITDIYCLKSIILIIGRVGAF